MKSIKNFLFILLALPLHLFAQDLDCRFFEWSHSWNHIGSGQIALKNTPIVTDQDGNSYFAGQFNGSRDFDNINLTASGGIAAFITKVDSAGQHIWAIKADSQLGAFEIEIKDIKIDQQGNSFILGSFLGSAQLGSFSFSAPLSQGYKGFFAKLNAQGQFVQAIQLGAIPAKIALDAGNNIYMIGSFNAPINLGSFSISSQGFSDIFVAKMDQQGQFAWVKSFGGLAHDYGTDIAVDNVGNCYFTGSFKGIINFENYTLNNVEDACYAVKLSSNGQVIWADNINNSNSNGRGIAIDSIGNSYIIGTFIDSMQINGQLLTTTNFNTFVAKVNVQGEFKDVIQFEDANGTNYGEYHVTNQISINPFSNSLYISSLFKNTLIVNNITYEVNVQNSWHVYFAELSTEKLGLRWLIAPKGIADSWTGGISSDSKGNLYASGLFRYSPLILGNDTFSSNGNYEKPAHFLTKIAGLNNLVVNTNDTLIAVQTNVNYQWLDCANNMAPIPGATSRSFYPGTIGQYAVALSNDFCTDTSACLQTTAIRQLSPLEKITVYPNPASSEITLDKLPRGSAITLYDLSGRKLRSVSNKEERSVHLSVQDLAEGLYFVEIVQQGSRVFKKVVVMKRE